MKQLISSRTLVIPEGVSVEVKARRVRVKGPRGECGNALQVAPGSAAMLHAGARPGARSGWRLRPQSGHRGMKAACSFWAPAQARQPPRTTMRRQGAGSTQPLGAQKMAGLQHGAPTASRTAAGSAASSVSTAVAGVAREAARRKAASTRT